MKIPLKRIVLLKQREKVLLNELKQIKEEILFIETLKDDQLGVYEKIRRIVSASIVKPLHGSKILLVFRGFHYRRATS